MFSWIKKYQSPFQLSTYTSFLLYLTLNFLMFLLCCYLYLVFILFYSIKYIFLVFRNMNLYLFYNSPFIVMVLFMLLLYTFNIQLLKYFIGIQKYWFLYQFLIMLLFFYSTLIFLMLLYAVIYVSLFFFLYTSFQIFWGIQMCKSLLFCNAFVSVLLYVFIIKFFKIFS